MKIYDMARLMAFSLAVSACAGATTATNAVYNKVGIPDIFNYAAADRDFLTEIYGNPGSGPKEAFDASVMAAAHGNARGLITNFTTTPSANMRKGYRMVMVFSGDPYTSAWTVCGNVVDASLKPVTGRVEIQAAFCYRDDVLSEVHVAYARGALGLENAVNQVVLNLFPLYDPNKDPGGDAFD